MIYISLLIWIIYSIIEGKREANFWHHRINSSDYEIFKDIDRHPLFVLQRGLMLICIGILGYLVTDSILWSGYLFIMNSLVFTFFHNGSMYLERLIMSMRSSPNNSDIWVYKDGWWSQSSTSVAVTTRFMTPVSRTIQMLLGILGYIIYLILFPIY